MKKSTILFTILCFLIIPLLSFAQKPVEFFEPRPLQHIVKDTESTIVYAEDLVSVEHPLLSDSINFSEAAGRQVTIDETVYDVGDFILTPGESFKFSPVNDRHVGFIYKGAKMFHGFPEQTTSLDRYTYTNITEIYTADVRQDDSESLVPPVIYTDSYLSPYDTPTAFTLGDVAAYSIAKMPTDDVVLITYDTVTLRNSRTGQREDFDSTIFYLKQMGQDAGQQHQSLYRMTGAIGTKEISASQIGNRHATDIETLDIDNDGNQDIAVTNRHFINGESYVLFFKGKGNQETNNIDEMFSWPEWNESYAVGKNPYDSAVTSDLVNPETGEWQDRLIVPIFEKVNERYIARKFSGHGNSIKPIDIELSLPWFIVQDCDNQEGSKCGPVRIDCTRHNSEADTTIFDLNNDGCGDCVITWGRLQENKPPLSSALHLYDGFTVLISKKAEQGHCAYKNFIVEGISAVLPRDDYKNTPSPQAFAIEIVDNNKIYIGDQAVYFYDDVDDADEKVDTLVYLFNSKIDENGIWNLLTLPGEVKAYKANYKSDYILENEINPKGVKAIKVDTAGNLGIINGTPFVPSLEKEEKPFEGCNDDATVTCMDGTEVRYGDFRTVFGIDNDPENKCIPKCRLLDEEQVFNGIPYNFIKNCDPVYDQKCGCQPNNKGMCSVDENENADFGFVHPEIDNDLLNQGIWIIYPYEWDIDQDCIPDCVQTRNADGDLIYLRCDGGVNNPHCPANDPGNGATLENDSNIFDYLIGTAHAQQFKKVIPKGAAAGAANVNDIVFLGDGGSLVPIKPNPSEATILIKKNLPEVIDEPKPSLGDFTCYQDVDRIDLPNDISKKGRLRIQKYNDQIREIIGRPMDLLVPEYYGTYSATQYVPVSFVSQLTSENRQAPSLILPFYQFSGMKVENYLRNRPVYTEKLVKPADPILLIPTEKLKVENSIPDVPNITVMPNEAVTTKNDSTYTINNMMEVKIDAYTDGVSEIIPGINMALTSPLRIMERGGGFRDGCAWSSAMCTTQVPPDAKRGMNLKALMEGLQEAVNKYGKPLPMDKIYDVLKTWDSTGYLVQKFSIMPPGGNIDQSIAQDSRMLLGSVTDFNPNLISAEDQEKINANIALAESRQGFCRGEVLFAVVPMDYSAQGSGGCGCDISREKPRLADVISYIFFAIFIFAIFRLKSVFKK